jgi:hypothetical protein
MYHCEETDRILFHDNLSKPGRRGVNRERRQTRKWALTVAFRTNMRTANRKEAATMDCYV